MACHLEIDGDPDPACHFNADPDPQHCEHVGLLLLTILWKNSELFSYDLCAYQLMEAEEWSVFGFGCTGVLLCMCENAQQNGCVNSRRLYFFF